MSKRPRVSIVTPFLDAAPFIAEAIESVLAQTFANWELLLVDDGSTDGSTDIALQYAASHSDRVRYLAHPSQATRGASASRNLGIQHSLGEYLAFLDADDVYLPGKLMDQIRILDGVYDAQVLYAATEYWYGWTGVGADAVRDWIWRPRGVAIGPTLLPPQVLVAFLNDGGTVPCMGSMLVRADAVTAVGGFEESFRRICTDQAFHAKLALRCRILFSNECWDRYRQHPNSSCQKVAAEGQTEASFVAYLKWLERYLRAEQVSDPSVWTALKQALRRYEPPILYRLARALTGSRSERA